MLSVLQPRPSRIFFKRTMAFSSGADHNKCLSLSLFCSDLNESERWSLLFQKIFNCKSTLLPSSKSGNVIHLLTHGNTQIQLVGNSFYSRVRNFVGHPRFTHLLRVSTNAVGVGSSSESYYPSLASALCKEQTVTQTQFIGSFRSSSSSSSSSSSLSTLNKDSLVRGVKEIVIPTMSSFSHDNLEKELGATAVESLVNVHELDMGVGKDKVYLRTAPTDRCQVVLKVDDLSVAMDRLNDLDIIFERIGATGMTGNANGGGQIKLRTSAFSFGEFDLRLTDSNTLPSPFFMEGEESVLEGAIMGIQNPRVLGGDTAKLLSQSSPSKDCWMEVRAMIRS